MSISLIQKFKNLFTKPDTSDQDRIDRWKNEVDEADRLKELHRQSRKQEKKKKKLTVQDFEKAAQRKKKNKTLSSNF